MPRILAIVAMLLPLSVMGAKPGITIDSVKVLSMEPDGLHIKVGASNDGSQGAIYVGAVAKSTNGMLRSLDMDSTLVPQGEAVQLDVVVKAPAGAAPLTTDLVLAKIYRDPLRPFATKVVPWRATWAQATSGALANRPLSFVVDCFVEGEYQAIDGQAAAWKEVGQRDVDGIGKLQTLMRGLQYLPKGDQREQTLSKIRDWRRQNPKSDMAAIAEALVWIAAANEVRGPVWRRSRDETALKLARDRFSKAKTALLSAKKFADVTPFWYELRLEVATELEGDKVVQAIFSEATSKYRRHLPLYRAMISYYTPAYGASQDWKKVDALVNQAVQAAPPGEGDATYALLYAFASDDQRIEFEVLRDSLASWPRMKRGFDDIIARHPDFDNLNRAAVFACRAGDRSAFLALHPRLVGHVQLRQWPSNYSYELCKRRYIESS